MNSLEIPNETDEVVLVLTPSRGDSMHVERVLQDAGIRLVLCRDIAHLAVLAAGGAGCVLLAHEALPSSEDNPLTTVLRQQPAWSDLAIIVAVGENARLSFETTRVLETWGHVLLLERPLRVPALLSAIRLARRARARQYLVRELLAERDELLSSLEQRVEERTAKLAASNEQLEAFSYTISHDLRAPLRALALFADALNEDFAETLPPRAMEYARKIHRAASRMERMTKDLLTYARLTTDAVPVSVQQLDAIIDDVIEQYGTVNPWGAKIEVRRPLGAALGHESVMVQCCANLLDNALRFVRPGEQPQVTVFTECQGDRVRIFFQDRGIGIAAEFQEKIFRVFGTLAGGQEARMGIGLAIVQKAVERMGGTVGVKSEFGQGSTFWIDLGRPLESAPATARPSFAKPTEGSLRPERG